LQERLGDLGIPMVGDLPFGHQGENAVLPVGTLVTLDGASGRLVWE
jgi:muramoyltetrapeptide carboxypeptidase